MTTEPLVVADAVNALRGLAPHIVVLSSGNGLVSLNLPLEQLEAIAANIAEQPVETYEAEYRDAESALAKVGGIHAKIAKLVDELAGAVES